MGLRGPEVRSPKPAGSRRILFIGDSVTYGGGKIREEALFCRIVEASLNKNGIAAEVVNLSAPGWSPQNWIRYVESNGFHEADLVVLTLPECDLARGFATMEENHFRDKAPPLRLQSVLAKLTFIYHASVDSRTVQASGSVAPAASDLRAERNIEAVSTLMRLCENREIPLLTVLTPTVPGSSDQRYWPEFKAVLPHVLDLTDKLNDPHLFFDGSHLNVAGHSLVGREIFDRLQKTIVSR
jgi:lysophospholipase L1-like esterase